MDNLVVRRAQEVDGPRWDEFLLRQKINDHSLSWAWCSILSQTFGHEPQYMMATTATDEIVGVLPLIELKSMLFGHAFVSVPYLNGGGIISRDPTAQTALLQKAIELSGKAKYLELRHQNRVAEFSQLQERSHKVTMVLPLMADTDELFKTFPAKLRSQIRRPEKSGARVEVADDERLLEPFYKVFSEHMRDLGTPVYPKKLFELVMRSSLRTKTFIVWYEGAAASCGMTIGFGNKVEILWASSLARYNYFSPNMILYWEALKSACVDGYRYFDFGRCSPEGGTYRFKKQWGCAEVPLYWYYHTNNSDLPDVNPNSSKFRLLVKCWQQLPLFLSNAIGPYLTKSLP